MAKVLLSKGNRRELEWKLYLKPDAKHGIIGSLRHLANEHLHNRLITRFFDYRNILLVLTFLPVTACFSLFRTSGRFDILARKK